MKARTIVALLALGVTGGAWFDDAEAGTTDVTITILRTETPGKVTVTPIADGVKITAWPTTSVRARMNCPLGWRATKLGNLVLPGTLRTEERTITPSLPTDVQGARAACRGGHAALLMAGDVPYACKQEATVVTQIMAKTATPPISWGQFEVTCETGDVPASPKLPLKLFWSADRGDNFTTATAAGATAASGSGYAYVSIEAQALKDAGTGRLPLKLYWHSGRGDNFLVAQPQEEVDAKAAGYTFVRTEGYILEKPATNTVPLELWWHAGRQDNMNVASSVAIEAAKAAGYTRVRLQGYAYKVPRTDELNSDGSFK